MLDRVSLDVVMHAFGNTQHFKNFMEFTTLLNYKCYGKLYEIDNNSK